ncbi:MAG: hypothetical protein V8R01_06740 [Bacilli bacterium]
MKKFNIKDHKTFRGYIQTIRDEVKYPRLIGRKLPIMVVIGLLKI